LAGKMTKDGHAVAILSGDLTVEQRISVLDRFRAGLEKVLITTNVLARGKYTKKDLYLFLYFMDSEFVAYNKNCFTYFP